MHEDLYQSMFAAEDRHWWYSAKRQIVLELLRQYAPQGGRQISVVDIGCGCGALLVELRRSSYAAIGVDDSPSARAFCSQRGIEVAEASLPDHLALPPQSCDAALLLDVLEHLPRDAESVQTVTRLLRPGGILICTVPAYRWLWSDWDEIHHHQRRYSRQSFSALFQLPQLYVEVMSFCNCFLFLPAAGARLVDRVLKARANKTDAPAKPFVSIRVPPVPVNALLRTIYASERHLLGRVPLPFGLSLIAVVRKREDVAG